MWCKYLQVIIAQDWPNLLWGRFSNIGVGSIILISYGTITCMSIKWLLYLSDIFIVFVFRKIWTKMAQLPTHPKMDWQTGHIKYRPPPTGRSNQLTTIQNQITGNRITDSKTPAREMKARTIKKKKKGEEPPKKFSGNKGNDFFTIFYELLN